MPNHHDWIEVFPDTAQTVVPYATGTRACESAVPLDDGRILYCMVVGGDIRQGYAASEEAFFANGSVTNVTTIFSGLRTPSCTAFRSPLGGIYLICAWTTGGHTGSSGFTGIYRSPSGLGGDWVLHGTMQTYAWGNVRFGSRNEDSNQCGHPEFLASGRWVVAMPIWTNNQVTVQAYGMRQGVYTSDDQGVTWTLRLNVGFYLSGGTNGFGQGRNLGNRRGVLYFTAEGNVDGNKDHISTDGGVTWTEYNASGGNNHGLCDGDEVLNFRSGGLVYRTTDPTTGLGTLVRDYPLDSGGAFSVIVQPLHRGWFVSLYGTCVLSPRSGFGTCVVDKFNRVGDTLGTADTGESWTHQLSRAAHTDEIGPVSDLRTNGDRVWTPLNFPSTPPYGYGQLVATVDHRTPSLKQGLDFILPWDSQGAVGFVSRWTSPSEFWHALVYRSVFGHYTLELQAFGSGSGPGVLINPFMDSSWTGRHRLECVCDGGVWTVSVNGTIYIRQTNVVHDTRYLTQYGSSPHHGVQLYFNHTVAPVTLDNYSGCSDAPPAGQGWIVGFVPMG